VNPIELVPGQLYRIRTQIGQQTLEREHVLTFLDYSTMNEGELFFNARPIAGTQTLNWVDIISVEHVGSNGTPGPRANHKHYVNKVVRSKSV